MSQVAPLIDRDAYQELQIKINHIYLTLFLEPQHTKVISLNRGICINEQDLQLVGENLSLETVVFNQQQLTSEQYQLEQRFGLDYLTIPKEFFKAGQTFELEVTSYCNPQANSSLQGLYYIASDDVFSTQCASCGFRAITFALDRPDNMVSFTTKIVAKQSYQYLLAGGNLIEQGTIGEQHYAIWEDPIPKASYIFALVAGTFDLVTQQHQTANGKIINLNVYVKQGKAGLTELAIDSLKRAIDWDSSYYGLDYDMDHYTIVAVPYFNFGAMENKGLNIFNDRFVICDTSSASDHVLAYVSHIIGHEYFHNWTGNRVTLRDFFQVTLKEGVTVFREQQFTAQYFNKDAMRIKNVKNLYASQFPEDRSSNRHCLRPKLVSHTNNLYTHTIYLKGAEIVRMNHTLLGEDLYKQGFKKFINKFDLTAATLEDFQSSFNGLTEIDFTGQYFEWYKQVGTPQVNFAVSYDPASQQLTCKAQQLHDHPQALLIPLLTQIYSATGQQLHFKNLTSGFTGDQELLISDQFTTSWVFSGVPQDAIVVTNLDYSAPIVVKSYLTMQQQAVVVKHCNNSFAIFNGLLELYKNCYLSNLNNLKDLATVDNYQLVESDYLIESYSYLLQQLTNPTTNQQLYIELLELITPQEMIPLLSDYQQLEPQDLLTIDQLLTNKIAQHNQQLIIELYQQIPRNDSFFSPDFYYWRKLQAILLKFITKLDPNHPAIAELYQSAGSLQQRLTSLTVALNNNSNCANQLEQDFLERYQDQALIMDNYYQIIAASSKVTLEKLISLTSDNFAYQIPNRVNSLFNSFANNLKLFHAVDGSGYQFYAQALLKVAQHNPHVSFLLARALSNFEQLSPVNQQLMIEQLQFLRTQNLNPNLIGLIDNALARAQQLGLLTD